MKKIALGTILLALAVPSTVQAQSILDTLRGLKKTAEALAGGKEEQGSNASTRASDGRPRHDVAEFEVVGIRLGMSPQEAREKMILKGFTVKGQNTGAKKAYEDLVQGEARRLNQPAPDLDITDGPLMFSGTDGARNYMEVGFIATPSGPIVSTVRLAFDHDTNDMSLLRSDILNRYAQPSFQDNGGGAYWCDLRAEAECGPVNYNWTAPSLAFRPGIVSSSLTLSNWSMNSKAQKEEIAALFSAPTADRQRSLLGS